MEYKLIRSKRKTIAICIGRDAAVTVRAPLKAPKCLIDKFIVEKQNWVCDKTEEIKKCGSERQNFEIKDGSLIQMLGKDYPVNISSKVCFDGNTFLVTAQSSEEIKRQIIEIYNEAALKVITERTDYFSKLTGLIPSKVRIGTANTYWGCCSGKNSINFSWKLIMAEPQVIDYVIIHELCHTVEHNHSKRFWHMVQKIIPDYKERRIKLKDLEKKLQTQDWSL